MYHFYLENYIFLVFSSMTLVEFPSLYDHQYHNGADFSIMLPSFLMVMYKQTFSLNLVVRTHVVFFLYNFVLSRMLQNAMV